MNIDLLFPTLTGDLTQTAKANPADQGGSGQDFEDMLVQQSKAQQQENSRPQKKTEDKRPPRSRNRRKAPRRTRYPRRAASLPLLW